ncbi:MAG TPA: WD40 repeat domain-containing protein [Pirellulales bacterium]|nr:WD40 repeat domain-containing protein [Pirellulales bacterium]
MSDAAQAPKADPAQTHVAVEWKYTSPFISCRFDPTGRFAFASAQDNTVQRWEVTSGANVSLAGHESWVRALAFSPDGQTLYTGGYEGRLIFWPAMADAPAPARTIEAHTGWLRGLAVSPDGSRIASCGNDNLVKLWNAADGALVQTLSGHTGNVFSVLFHPGGQWLLSGDLMGQVHQWEVTSGKLMRSFDAKELHTYEKGQAVDYGGVRSMALSPDGKSLACSGLHKATNPLGAVQDPLVMEFDWESAKPRISHAPDAKSIAWRIVYHPDGYLIAGCGGTNPLFLFFKSDQDKEFFRFALPNTARDMDLHRDGVQLVTAHFDNHVRISRMTPKAA